MQRRNAYERKLKIISRQSGLIMQHVFDTLTLQDVRADIVL